MAASGPPPRHACKCLNVRIRGLPPPGPPQEPLNGSFAPVFVGEEGVTVAHIQLTLRHKGPRTERTVAGRTEAFRVVSLTCLVCETLVYRISQVILPDVESGEGLVLPTDEWVEKEVLRSADGWIQVSKGALDDKGITEAEKSPQYSHTFNIVLPPEEARPTEQREEPQHPFLTSPQTPRTTSPTLPETILPQLPELFPPPPFTPAHPVFTHLASIAHAESEQLRASAEAYVRKVLQDKIAEVQAAETKLKQDVERMWSTFKSVVQKLEEEDVAPPLRLKTRRSSSRGRGPTASVRVTDFVPTPSPPPRQTHRAAAPSQSALSASLATSNLQDVMRGRGRAQSPTTGSKSPSRAARTDSPSTASSKTLGMTINGEAEIREAHRRNMDQSLDVATSFKYMMDLSAHMDAAARVPQPVQEEDEEDTAHDVPSPSTSAVPRGRSPRAGKSAIKKPKANGDAAPAAAPKAPGSPVRKPQEANASQQPEPTTPTKGKRKVTFDVEPDVAIIPDTTVKTPSPRVELPEEEVFEMESETLGDIRDAQMPAEVATPQPEFPAQEPIRLARRPKRYRQTSNSGLPSSLSSLRPASLPAPSAMRRVVAFDKLDDRSRTQAIRESVLSPSAEGDMKRREVDAEEMRELKDEQDEEHNAHEAEVLRLVAASMPSHRSAWKKDSAAWRTFVNREKTGHKPAIIEEDESSAAEGSAFYDESTDSSGPDEESRVDDWAGGTVIAKSLPIPIGPLGSARPNYGMPPFRKNADGLVSGSLDKVSAAAMRRASYAQRDRMREIDPGALDFDIEEEDEEEVAQFMENDTQVGGKSMQRAMNILQKHSEIPNAGMWRSLA